VRERDEAVRERDEAVRERDEAVRERDEAVRERERLELERNKWESAQQETDKHLQGALRRIEDIKNSLSYRLGRALTWPIRIPYDLLLGKSIEQSEKDHPFLTLLRLVFRHPIRSLRVLNWERIRNVYVVFVKKPSTAKDVVGYYARMFEDSSPVQGSGDLTAVPIKTRHDSGRKVSIVIVNYNGRRHLPTLLSSLRCQTWHEAEIIVVDNGSSDGSVEYIENNFPTVKLVCLTHNVGFAEGVNIGAEIAEGEYLALLNNDMEVDPNWLSELVGCLERFPHAGAVGSKIRFWKKFITIELENLGGTEIWMDEATLEQSMPVYPKWFLVDGWERVKQSGETSVSSFRRKAVLYIPVCEGQAQIRLRLKCIDSKGGHIRITSTLLDRPITYPMTDSWSEVILDFIGKESHPALAYVINNAGSQVSEQGEVRDRGFGEYDRGQFDVEEPVSALCGGAMLIRREALGDQPVFAPDYFAYFEDTDLSLRLRKQGWSLLYCPTSIVYHKHASSSKEGSSFFMYQVNRNRILFLAQHFPKPLWTREYQQARATLNHLHHYWKDDPSRLTTEERAFAQRIPELFQEWDELLGRIERGVFLIRQRRFPRIAVYNKFWSTLGGGEHHAAVIAQVLQQLGPVDLIAEAPFDIDRLERHFGLDLRFCRQRIVAPEVLHHSDFTSRYDLFINSTFASDLKCAAKLSYYVVSFPYRLDDRPPEARAFIETYDRFLVNSEYTARWLKRWWGVEGDVLYPSITLPEEVPEPREKERLILHVGRFFNEGHNKKQLELVSAFKRLCDRHLLPEGWKLVLVGRVHKDQYDYFQRVRSEAAGYPVEIYEDLPLPDLQALYRKAAIYWHATGLNENLEEKPELYEHFGISTVEAVSWGCVPVVINAGGQPEIVEHGVNGFLFIDEDGLIEITRYCAQMFANDQEAFARLSRAARRRAADFSRTRLQARFEQILREDGMCRNSEYRLVSRLT